MFKISRFKYIYKRFNTEMQNMKYLKYACDKMNKIKAKQTSKQTDSYSTVQKFGGLVIFFLKINTFI